jgi:hypothetical protein
MAAQTFRDLTVYKKAFTQAMEIYQLSRKFPQEERYSLTVGKLLNHMIENPEKYSRKT